MQRFFMEKIHTNSLFRQFSLAASPRHGYLDDSRPAFLFFFLSTLLKEIAPKTCRNT